jgi:hypothetical protein
MGPRAYGSRQALGWWSEAENFFERSRVLFGSPSRLDIPLNPRPLPFLLNPTNDVRAKEYNAQECG